MASTMIEPVAPGTKIDRFVEQLAAVRAEPRLIGPDGEEIPLPVEIYQVLCEVAEAIRRGNGITVMPLSAVLTTAQAAELLNVSRPHVVKLIDAGEIRHHMVGKHRRVALADLIAYKNTRDEIRRAALAEMHAIADETGMDL